MKARPTKQEIMQEFMRGRNCAQCTLGRFAEHLGYDQEETDKFVLCFGGGMLMGQTCGAVTGGLMAIGLFSQSREEAEKKGAAFEQAFKKRYGSTLCEELLGYNMGVPEQAEQARASGRLLEDCPRFVEGAMEIVETILKD